MRIYLSLKSQRLFYNFSSIYYNSITKHPKKVKLKHKKPETFLATDIHGLNTDYFSFFLSFYPC